VVVVVANIPLLNADPPLTLRLLRDVAGTEVDMDTSDIAVVERWMGLSREEDLWMDLSRSLWEADFLRREKEERELGMATLVLVVEGGGPGRLEGCAPDAHTCELNDTTTCRPPHERCEQTKGVSTFVVSTFVECVSCQGPTL